MNDKNIYKNDSITANSFTPSISASKDEICDHSKRDNQSYSDWKTKRRELLEERHQIERTTLESCKESLGMICETEKIGLKTAQELVRQREQLNSVEEKLDSMNSTLKISEKHLTSMKSIFGRFKNYFTPNTKKTPEIEENISNTIDDSLNESSSTSLMNTMEEIEKSNNRQNHQIIKNNIKADNENYKDNEMIDYWLKSRQIDEELELNFSEIDSGVGRLKQLSLNLGNEIDSQNSLLERINKQSERNELILKHQNSQINQILKR